MEIESLPFQSKYDWLRVDKDNYLNLSYTAVNLPFPDDLLNKNSFCKACIQIAKDHAPDEFNSIRQRNAFYDFISYTLEWSNFSNKKIKDIKFFSATTIVTVWNILGAAESIGRKLVLSDKTIAVLTDINKLLFSENMFVIRFLLFSETLNIPYKFVNYNPSVINPVEISSFEFDLQMVRFEQLYVQIYINSHSQNLSSQVIDEINETINDDGLLTYLLKFFRPKNLSDNAIDWAKKVLQLDKLDFMVHKNRTTIGFALIHILHQKSFFEFNSFINNSN